MSSRSRQWFTYLLWFTVCPFREVVPVLHSYGGAAEIKAAKGMSTHKCAAQEINDGIKSLIFMYASLLEVSKGVGGVSLPRPDLGPVKFDDVNRNAFFLFVSPMFYAILD